MSIVAYVGIPGSGKSYGVVENVIVPALKAGRTVVHNFRLEVDAIADYVGISCGTLVELPERCDAHAVVQHGIDYAGAVFVLDEAWRFWPAGTHANKIPDAEKEFFAMHRHRVGPDGHSSEIVLVTQDLAQCSAFLRSLVEQTFRATKLTAVGSTRRYRIDIYEGAVTGQQPPAARRLREIFGVYKPEIFTLYRSHTQSKSGTAGAEVKADRRGNVLHGARLKLAVIAVLLLPAAVWAAAHSLQRLGGSKETPPAAERSEAAAASAPATVHDVDLHESSRWRLAGEIVVDGLPTVILDSDRGPKLIPAELCRRDAGRNRVCVVSGELVAFWTGARESAPNSMFAAGEPETPQ